MRSPLTHKFLERSIRATLRSSCQDFVSHSSIDERYDPLTVLCVVWESHFDGADLVKSLDLIPC
jgi:hypothetical protein